MLGWLRKSIQSFFQVSRSESNAFLILIPLMIIVLFSEYIYRQWWFSHPRDTQADERKLDSLLALWAADTTPVVMPTAAVAFNPNHVSLEFLINTGLRSDLAQRVIHYRNKGGTFRVKTDLLKMYGMDTVWFKRQRGWLLLPDSLPRTQNKKSFLRTRQPSFMQDINQVDSIGLLAVRGIGPVFANRILRFRTALGGFYSMEQLREVYKIDTALVRAMKKQFQVAPDFQPVRININTADEAQLAKHPYLTRNQAKAILAYRFQHGPFQNLEDLKKIQLISASDWQRIIPYLER